MLSNKAPNASCQKIKPKGSWPVETMCLVMIMVLPQTLPNSSNQAKGTRLVGFSLEVFYTRKFFPDSYSVSFKTFNVLRCPLGLPLIDFHWYFVVFNCMPSCSVFTLAQKVFCGRWKGEFTAGCDDPVPR